MLLSGLAQAGAESCQGSFFNPITDTNWNYMYPITIAGVSTGANMNPPIMYEPPICVCPSKMFGIPTPGIGISYWEPLQLVEVERSAGCMSTLGGLSILSSYGMLDGERIEGSSTDGGSIGRMQVHQYEYPVFALLDFFTSFTCLKLPEYNVGWMTEVDPFWQDDLWSVVYNPEAILFANPVAQLACSVDAVAASAAFPLDALYWCAGSWGSIYPLTGNAGQSQSSQGSNALVLSKFLARQSRLGLIQMTVGPTAQCFGHYTPVLVKNQFRVNPVAPRAYRMPKPIYIGASEWQWGYAPPANYPTRESSAYLMWQGKQCCLHP